nr:adhesion G protein-coupled receptor E3-like [Biomphalaria glabrata]
MDPDIVEACDNLNRHTYQIFSAYNNEYYKNIFCMICDLMSYPFYACSAISADQTFDSRILYQMLINFEDLHEFSVDENVNQCNETTWAAPNGECLQLRCSPGKTLQNGT